MNSSQPLATALQVLRREGADVQVAHTQLVRIIDILAGASASLTCLINSHLAPSEVVRDLVDLCQLHLGHEEIAWDFCQLLTMVCQRAPRFKLEAGHLHTDRLLRCVRMAHPESPRVLEAALACEEALLHDVELHQLETRPTQALISEMLEYMANFHVRDPQRREMRLSPHFDFARLVVGALRVLVALYQSTRVSPLLASPDSSEGDCSVRVQILKAMLSTWDVFIIEPSRTRVWLAMAMVQVRQRTETVIPVIFGPQSQRASPWFVEILEKWGDDTEVMLAFCALFTHVFAVPEHIVSGSSETLPRLLILEHPVLSRACNVLARLASRREEDRRVDVVMLELARLLRQWSHVPAMLELFPKIREVKSTLLPLAIELLATHSRQLASAESRGMRMVLEIVLLLQQLGKCHPSMAEALQVSEAFQTALTRSIKRLAAEGDHDGASDGDLVAVLGRELRRAALAFPTKVPRAPPKSRLGYLATATRTSATSSLASRASNNRSGGSGNDTKLFAAALSSSSLSSQGQRILGEKTPSLRRSPSSSLGRTAATILQGQATPPTPSRP